MYVILQYVSFGQELKIEKIAVSGVIFLIFIYIWNFWNPNLSCHSIHPS